MVAGGAGDRRVDPARGACYCSGMGIARALVAAAIVCLLPLTAEAAPGKAWAAAKASLPPTTEVIVGLDLTQLTRTTLFKMALPMLLARQAEIKAGLDEVKATCGIDPLKNIEAVVIGTDKDQRQGAMFLAVNNLDETAIVTCLRAIAAKDIKVPQITVATSGGITELSVDQDKIYLRWVGKDVIVLPLGFGDRKQLAQWTGGRKALGKAPVGKYLGKVDPRTALWAVSAVPQELEGTRMTAGYGSLATTKGSLMPDLHVVMTSAADATATADKANQELATMASGSGLADNLKQLLQQIRVSAVGAEVVVKATIAERDLLAIAGALMRGM